MVSIGMQIFSKRNVLKLIKLANMDICIWNQFKNLVNSKQLQSLLTRREIQDKLLGGSITYLDNLRNMAEKLGHLEKVTHGDSYKAGHFKVVKHIPISVTLTKFKKDYYSRLEGLSQSSRLTNRIEEKINE